MIKISLSEIAKILRCPSPAFNDLIIGVSRDTRDILPNNLYIAIVGEQYDGHHFVQEAAKKGAKAALVNHPVDAPIPQIIVNDTIEALGILSIHWRNRFNIPFIGITGSNGKTTLKNMVASILHAACQHDAEAVLATQGTLNNHIGLPLTLLQLHEKHRYGVIEMGMNHFNEIAYLTKITRPAVAIINNAAESHLEGLKTIGGVAQAKGEILQGLPAHGIAILNRDDAYFEYWHQLIENHSYLTFGLQNTADISADILSSQHIQIHTPQGKINVSLPLLGKHNIMNSLAATAAALALNIDLAAIQHGLENLLPAPGRMQLVTLDNGAKIIDDTYNANPFSLKAAAQTLASFPGTKIIILGDMKELGDNAKQLHFDAGIQIKKLGIHHLFTLGQLTAETQRGFGENAHHFTDWEQLTAMAKPYLKENTTLLVKGSRSMKMERIIQCLVPAKQPENIH